MVPPRNRRVSQRCSPAEFDSCKFLGRLPFCLRRVSVLLASANVALRRISLAQVEIDMRQHTMWHEVEASVHLSLTPMELGAGGMGARIAATRHAFASLLMRYHPELGGVVVAHRGGLRFPGDCANAHFIAASPFVHVTAYATLLLFAPAAGTSMVGSVTHVGPDHIGMSVLGAFHAVLPFSQMEAQYEFHQVFSGNSTTRSWRYTGATRDADECTITVGRQVRFHVSNLRPTKSGLFQISAAVPLSSSNRNSEGELLGVLPRSEEIPAVSSACQLIGDSPHNTGTERTAGDETIGIAHVRMVSPVKRRYSTQLQSADGILAGSNFDDALMCTPVQPSKSSKSKKRRRSTGVDLPPPKSMSSIAPAPGPMRASTAVKRPRAARTSALTTTQALDVEGSLSRIEEQIIEVGKNVGEKEHAAGGLSAKHRKQKRPHAKQDSELSEKPSELILKKDRSVRERDAVEMVTEKRRKKRKRFKSEGDLSQKELAKVMEREGTEVVPTSGEGSEEKPRKKRKKERTSSKLLATVSQKVAGLISRKFS